MSEDLETRMRFVYALRSAGVTDPAVLSAMESVPREYFVDEEFSAHAYEDTALPIACAQTISMPSVVAAMTQALELDRGCKVLEIGTGSGYQTAILARLARRIYSVERHGALARLAEHRMADLGITNVVMRHGDGAPGWPEQAPFDRILAAAAADDIPRTLLDQLKVGGILVAPVGDEDGEQQLLKVTKTEEGPVYSEMMAVRFVPLLSGVAPENG